MDTGNNPQRPRLHPLVATAAIAVIVLAAVGVTTMVMNRSDATPSPYAAAPLVAAPSDPVATPKPVEPETRPEAMPAAPKPAPRIASSSPSSPSYAPPIETAPVTPTYREAPIAQAPPPICRNCGVVDSIRDIKVKGQATGVGAVGGAVVGGLLGNMVGAGRGKALATVAGAVGGGLGGNAIEKNVRSEVEHQMVVRLEDGSTRTFTQVNPFPYAIGERVRIVNGHVERG